MEELVISPDFTIEDIHKVRENNYNITKDMTPQERRDYYNKRGMEVHRQIQERKLQKAQCQAIEAPTEGASLIFLQAKGNCHLYEKCGFVRVGEEHIVNEFMTLIDYEKSVKSDDKVVLQVEWYGVIIDRRQYFRICFLD